MIQYRIFTGLGRLLEKAHVQIQVICINKTIRIGETFVVQDYAFLTIVSCLYLVSAQRIIPASCYVLDAPIYENFIYQKGLLCPTIRGYKVMLLR